MTINEVAGIIASGEKPNLIAHIRNQFTWSGVQSCKISQIRTIARQNQNYYSKLIAQGVSKTPSDEQRVIKRLINGELPEFAKWLCAGSWPSNLDDWRLEELLYVLQNGISCRKWMQQVGELWGDATLTYIAEPDHKGWCMHSPVTINLLAVNYYRIFQ